MASTLSVRDTYGAKVVGFLDQTLLDAGVVERVGQDLRALLHDAPAAIVLDFQRVAQMSSQALGAMIGLYHQAAAGNCEVVLSGANAHLSKLFGLTALDKIFRLFDSSEKALNYLRAGPLKALLTKDGKAHA